jgi:putative transposase
MGRRARELSSTGIYHIIARGINREHIFETADDYYHFQTIVREIKKELNFSIYAYCFMSNHIHMLIKEKDEQDISEIMKRIFVRYARYFNDKYSRSGSLIGNRFKSKPVEVDEYLYPLIVYIHRNPVEAGMECRAEHYPYSSYRDYFGNNRSWLDGYRFCAEYDETLRHLKKLHDNNYDFDFILEMVEARKEEVNLYKDTVIKEVLGNLSAFEISGLHRNKRNKFIRKLKESGLSIREIERLTGISRGIIWRCVK